MSDLVVPEWASVTEQECKEHFYVLLGVRQAWVSPPPCDPSARGSGLECHCRVIGLSVSYLPHAHTKPDTTHTVLSFTGLWKYV